MATKWTPERLAKFRATMKRRRESRTNTAGPKNGNALPAELERALYLHYRKRVISELLQESADRE